MMVLVRYHKPGGDTREWEQTLLADREEIIVSTFRFRLKKPFSPFNYRVLIKDGYYGVMFDLFDRWYNVVKIYDFEKDHIGYYSDIRTPPERIKSGYRAEDLFLDFWVELDGSYIILDIDEFQESELSEKMKNKVKSAALKLKNMIEEERYPPIEINRFDVPADEIGKL